jgi:iron complex outermembrane recepter protein
MEIFTRAIGNIWNRRRGAGISLAAGGLLFFHSMSNAQSDTNSPAGVDTNSPEALKQLSLEQLMDMDVTSVAREAEPYKEAAAALQVVTGDEIERSGAQTIPEALQLADNLDVAQAGSSSWDISARGFNASGFSDKLLVLLDGRSIYTPLLAGVIWNMQDYLLEDIDRIEVISGPGGTLWGANAVNGVINITTKSAEDTQGLYVDGGGGTWLQDFGAARYGGTLASNVYYRVYGKYFDYGPEVYADGTSAHDGWNRGQGGFRIDTDSSADNTFTLQGDAFGGDTDTQPGGEGNAQAEGTSSGENILGRWTHTFAEDSSMQLQLYYDRTHLAAPFQSAGPTIPAGTLFEDLDTADLDFQDRFTLGDRNHIVWGFGYEFTHDSVQNEPLVAFLPSTLDQDLFSGFLQDEIKLLEKVHLTIGSKLEHNDYTGVEYEPSARLQWNVTENQMIWGAVSRSVRMPARYDRDLYEPNPGYGTLLAGNSTFQSETVIAYELGYRAQLARYVSGSVSAFYNDYNNLRSYTYTPGTLIPLYFANYLRGDTYGFELSADFQVLPQWRLDAGYDLLKETIYVSPGQPADDEPLNEQNILSTTADPQQQVFLRSSMDLPGRTELDANARWIDTVQNNNGSIAGNVPSYFELDLRAAWHVTKKIEVSAVGQNLLQAQHPEAGFPGPAQEQIVRSMYGEVSCRF